ncbi:MAG: hypothetical protein K0V04_25725 [Deltaproteobacteria bacterium]|nr:hypothetical protein [Deltaproteobacteria bacterium]
MIAAGRVCGACALVLALGCTPGELDDQFAETSDGDHQHEAPAAHAVIPLPLVATDDWRPGSAQDDPLRHERPATIDCPVAAWGPELGGLEVQTGSCGYFHVVQPSLVTIAPGDLIEVVVFHDRLDAAEASEGHVAVMLGDEVIWEQHVDIPSDAAVLEERWFADRAWPAGTRVGIHLHNHGYNAWTVLELTVLPSVPQR